MPSNLERFKTDLVALRGKGDLLHMAMQFDCHPKEFEARVKKQLKSKAGAYLKSLPSFHIEYQRWYSEAIALVRQVLPDRLGDFVRLYEKPKARKEISYENYRIEDYLQNLQVTRGYDSRSW